MAERSLRHRLPIRLILAIVVLALAWSPLSATVMPGEAGSPPGLLADSGDSAERMPCHGGAAVDAADDDKACPHCDSPLHALCTCCPTAASVAIPMTDLGASPVPYARAPAAVGRVAALPHGPGERLFRPPIAHR